MRKLTFEFIDIKVNENWEVVYNTLTHLNPDDGSMTKEELEHYSLGLLTEDLLQIKSKSRFIDVGWYPDSDIEGEFHFRLLPYHEKEGISWEKDIYKLKTKSLDKLLFCIEVITSVI